MNVIINLDKMVADGFELAEEFAKTNSERVMRRALEHCKEVCLIYRYSSGSEKRKAGKFLKDIFMAPSVKDAVDMLTYFSVDELLERRRQNMGM